MNSEIAENANQRKYLDRRAPLFLRDIEQQLFLDVWFPSRQSGWILLFGASIVRSVF